MVEVAVTEIPGAPRLKVVPARMLVNRHLTDDGDVYTRSAPYADSAARLGDPAAFPILRREAARGPRTFILLSTHNGASYLQAQLDSLLAQTHENWVLYWRDDASCDETVELLTEFAQAVGEDRCVRVAEPPGRLWPAASFLTILRAALPAIGRGDFVAFADQDDVWLPDKLGRGLSALTNVEKATPALYCARLNVVDAELRHLTETSIAGEKCGFPASLTQNIATGCTIMLNHRAAELIAASHPPAASPHDWWCYLVVTAAGGRVFVDDALVALYRQHRGNFIGVPLSRTRRAIAAVRRGPGIFMAVFRQHLAAFIAQPELTTDATRAMILDLHRALQGGPRQRLRVLMMPGLRRQSWLETLLFRFWFLIG